MKKTLMVMDSSGDSRIEFDDKIEDTDQDEAKALFERLTKQGAAVFSVNRTNGASDLKVTDFSQLEAQNVIVPKIAGG